MEALVFNMVTVCVSAEALALLLTEEETSDVLHLVRLSLEKAGLEPWGDLEAEFFDRGGGGLLLARPRSPLLCRGAYQRRARRRIT
jgi:hypothetical protein